MNRRAVNLLAEVIVGGEWSVADVTSRIKHSIGRPASRSKWPQKLTERIFEHIHFFTAAPSVAKLAAFLQQDDRARQITNRADKAIVSWAANFNVLDLPGPLMQPAGVAAKTWTVPPIVTVGQLAERLQLPASHLDWMADCRANEHTTEKEKLRNYRYHWIRKSSGGLRLLEAPKRNLKHSQRWITDNILAHIPVHDAAHAFRPGRSPITAARQHTGQHVVLRIDLCDFFPTINAARVAGIFRTAGYPGKVVRLLTGLCTNTAWQGVLDEVVPFAGDQSLRRDARYQPLFQPHLPQGSPASPALANLCARALDCRLDGLAKKLNVRYTRYADDLVFSGGRSFGNHLQRFRILVMAICLDEGFEIRKRKTTVMRQHQQQKVTGIVVNTRPTIARKDCDQLKAILHNCVSSGPLSQNRDAHPNFRAHLAGRIAWVSAVDSKKGVRLQKTFDAISW